MEANNPFTEQVRLLVALLPSVTKRRQADDKLEKVLFE